ncbi:MAG: STAS domain-containing protein [Deltaproteobacteria bacterium]|jgi:anti-sigma B factor antagonist|nr:STAS domain-containing protein [Deltaproteobacteria bacterium]
MKLDIIDEGARVIVNVSGRLEAITVAAFDEIAQSLPGVKPPRSILLDLSRLDFISSAGLRSLLTLGKACRVSGDRLAFCSLNAMVADVFNISGFKQIFKIYPDRNEAFAAWEKEAL